MLVVKIGDHVFYKDADTDFVLREVANLRKFFFYDSNSKTWVFDPAKFDGNSDALCEYVAELFDVGKSEVYSIVKETVRKYYSEEYVEKLRKLLERGIFAVVPSEPLDEKRRLYADTFFTHRRGLYFLDVDKVTNYVILRKVRSAKTLARAIKYAMDVCGFRYLDGHVEWLEANAKTLLEDAMREYARRTTMVLNDTGSDVEILIGRSLTKRELAILRETFTTVYYTADAMGNLTEHRMRVIKYDRSRGTFRIPYFAVPRLLKVAQDLGFKKVVDNVRWIRKKIPTPPKFELKLYKFQARALKAWARAGFRGVIVVPTGGGKTYIGMAALYHLSVPTLICVTTIELARQWKQKLEEHLGIKAALLGGGSREIGDVTVAIYNSAVNHVDALKDKFELIIFDEVHHVPADSFRKVAFLCKARKRLGLSATPKRSDRNEALIFFSVGDVVFKASYRDMVKLKLAAPLKYYRFYVRLNSEEAAKYAQSAGGNPSKVQRMMKIAFTASEKYDVLKRIIQRLPDDKILVFCQYIDQAEKAYKAIRNVAPKQAVLLTGKTDAKLRKRYFEQFKEGKKRIIVTTTVLDEGIDVPDAETAIILSGTGTERQMIQRIGRVIRYRPGKVAKVIEIVTRGTVEEKIAERRARVLKEYGIRLKKEKN